MFQRRFASDGFKMPIEIGETVIPAIVTDIGYTFVCFCQQLTGLPYPDLYQKLGKCLLNP